MPKIIELPEDVYSKIAAGEVIDGPYSVVRELVDNSIDAGATRIKIITVGGGRESIVVEDNGEGMTWDDAALSVKRHTTSKIRSADDLQKIQTMGFRGEALCSISSVSNFELCTKNDGEEHGVRLVYRFGNFVSIEPYPFSRGTRVSVKNLFENLPARRKFMKSSRAESARIKSVVVKKALAFANIGFFYRSEDREIFNLASFQSPGDRIASIFGVDIVPHLIQFEEKYGFFSIRGFITDRDYTMSDRSGQYLFINRRPVFSRSIQYILNESAKRFVPKGRYVYAFVYIDIKPEFIDVNVHPAKLEVKIKGERDVVSSLYHIVEDIFSRRIYTVDGSSLRVEDGTGSKDESAVRPNRTHSFNIVEKATEPNKNRSGIIESSERMNIKSGAGNISYKSGAINKVSDITDSANYGLSDYSFSKEKFNLESITESDLESLILSDENSINFVGGVFGTYLIFTREEDLLLIDQHAAHERILYEEFMERYKSDIPVSNLLIPITLTPPAKYLDEFSNSLEKFRKIGIVIEPFGDNTFNIVGVPGFLPGDKEAGLLAEFFQDYFDNNRFYISTGTDALRDRFLKFAACRAAVKEGDRLSRDEAVFLLSKLLKCRTPYMCPHGRPTILKVSKKRLDGLFERR